MKKIDDNPFSFESYLLRDAQRITAEICERREHKISNSAVISVQRSFQLFKESESDISTTPKIPRNSTPEEEKLFHALVDSLISYREKMMGPLRFLNSPAKDDLSDVSADTPLNIKEEKPPKIERNKPVPDNLDVKDEEAKKNLDNPEIKHNKVFTAEEEAAIEDDIFKQFGKEPFPGRVTKDNIKSSKKSFSDNSQTVKSDSSEKNPELSINQGIKDSKNQNIKTDMLLVLEELPSIMGIDKKVYGPLLPQDIVTMPEENARILIKNQKGKSIQKYK
jgi:DNA replication factor GINS